MTPKPACLALLLCWGCLVVPDAQLADWLDPDGDGVPLGQDCANDDAQRWDCADTGAGGDGPWNAEGERDGEADSDAWVIADHTGAARRMGVVVGGGGALVAPESGLAEVHSVVWLSADERGFIEQRKWTAPAGLGVPGGLAMAPVSRDSDGFAVGFPEHQGGEGLVYLTEAEPQTGNEVVLSSNAVQAAGGPAESFGHALVAGTLATDAQADDGAVAVGVPGASEVRVFQIDAFPAGQPLVPALQRGGALGTSLAIVRVDDAGEYLVAGAPEANGGEGAVYLWRWDQDSLDGPPVSIQGDAGQGLGTHIQTVPAPDNGTWLVIEGVAGVRVLSLHGGLMGGGQDHRASDLGGHWISVQPGAWGFAAGALGTVQQTREAGNGVEGASWLPIVGATRQGGLCDAFFAPDPTEGAVFLFDVADLGRPDQSASAVTQWTVDDARGAICLDRGTSQGVSTAIIGTPAQGESLVITRPAMNTTDVTVQLYQDLGSL